MFSVRRSALKHGLSEEDVVHAVSFAIGVFDIERDKEPHKQLVLGPDMNGNLIEVIGIYEQSKEPVFIHAMKARKNTLHVLDDRGKNND
jgi:hypothetical protein